MKFWMLPREEHKRLKDMLLNKHYAQRVPQIKFAFVCGDDEQILGCCTFSRPASYTLCNGVCGKEHRSSVLELSRLFLENNEKNMASRLVGYSLRNLPQRPAVIVSYADGNEGHVGYVYQATNWIYTGRGNPEPWWAHPDTGEVISKTRRHIDKKAERFGLHWKDLTRIPKDGKHRYIALIGSRRDRRNLHSSLRYDVQPYPKAARQSSGTRNPLGGTNVTESNVDELSESRVC